MLICFFFMIFSSFPFLDSLRFRLPASYFTSSSGIYSRSLGIPILSGRQIEDSSRRRIYRSSLRESFFRIRVNCYDELEAVAPDIVQVMPGTTLESYILLIFKPARRRSGRLELKTCKTIASKLSPTIICTSSLSSHSVSLLGRGSFFTLLQKRSERCPTSLVFDPRSRGLLFGGCRPKMRFKLFYCRVLTARRSDCFRFLHSNLCSPSSLPTISARFAYRHTFFPVSGSMSALRSFSSFSKSIDSDFSKTHTTSPSHRNTSKEPFSSPFLK